MPDSSDSPSGNGDVSGRTNEGRKEGGTRENPVAMCDRETMRGRERAEEAEAKL